MATQPHKYIDIDLSELEDEFDEDYYDARGNPTPGGFYDAGGHLIGERLAEYADYLRDMERDRDI